MQEEHSVHVVAAANPLYGAVNFVVLTLPPGWRMVAGNLPPEIERIVTVDGVQWVASGSATSYAYNAKEGKMMEIKVRISRKPFKWRKGGAPERTVVGGHEASYTLTSETVGLLRKRRLEVLVVRFYCDHTNRHIEIKLRGPVQPSALREALQHLVGVTCH